MLETSVVLFCFNLNYENPQTPHFYDFETFERVHEPQNQYDVWLPSLTSMVSDVQISEEYEAQVPASMVLESRAKTHHVTTNQAGTVDLGLYDLRV